MIRRSLPSFHMNAHPVRVIDHIRVALSRNKLRTNVRMRFQKKNQNKKRITDAISAFVFHNIDRNTIYRLNGAPSPSLHTQAIQRIRVP